MRRLSPIFLALLVAAACVPVAYAITNGEPDGGAHPYVGLVAFYDADGVYVQRCTGTLMAPAVLLTAAHCAFADDGTRLTEARVWFDPVVGPGVLSGKLGGTPGRAVPHPAFDGYASFPDSNDVGVVLLGAAQTGRGLGALPVVGLLDTVSRKTASFTLVGYGFEQLKPVEITGDRTRNRTTAVLGGPNGSKTAGFNLRTKAGKSGGGFCSGDSGGPVLVGESNVVVAVSSLVQQSCKAYALSTRIDTKSIQDWLAPYLG